VLPATVVEGWSDVEGAVPAMLGGGAVDGLALGGRAAVVLGWSVVLLGLGAVVVLDDAVVVVSSWRPQPARTAATARVVALAASVSFFMGSLPVVSCEIWEMRAVRREGRVHQPLPSQSDKSRQRAAPGSVQRCASGVAACALPARGCSGKGRRPLPHPLAFAYGHLDN
jgi:hypothetical protein